MIWIETNGKRVAKALHSIVKDIDRVMHSRKAQFGHIMRMGTKRHFTILSLGGSVQDVNGRNIAWSTARHPVTIKIREKMGLGGTTPMLFQTGKLQTRYVQNAVVVPPRTVPGGRVMSYRGSRDDGLGRVHQYGGFRIPNGTALDDIFRGVTIPPRPFLFWDKLMARQVMDEVKAHIKGSIKNAKGGF